MKKINVKGPIMSNDTAWIYHYFGWDAASPNTISEGLEEAAGEDVVIEINSPGGTCVYAYEMYTAIREYKGKVTAHVISACSAATLLVCAADKALISDTGLFMIHNAQSRAEGDHRNMQMEADALREIDAGIINAYVRKTGRSREEIQNLMDNNSYMSPQKAIDYGFIDDYMFAVPTTEEPKTKIDVTNIAAASIPIIAEDKAKYLMRLIKMDDILQAKNQTKENGGSLENDIVPEYRVSSVHQKNEDNGVATDPNIKEKKGENEMNLKEFLAQNPVAQKEVDEMIAEAKAEGIASERARIKSLDEISACVTTEALQEAKYGKKPLDGQALAYQAMVNGEKIAASYMANAIQDANDSEVDKVGTGDVESENHINKEDQMTADQMAEVVNKTRGGK